MDRILIVLAGEDYADVAPALESARSAAAAPERLSFGLALTHEPDAAQQAGMQALGTVLFVVPAQDPWTLVSSLWQGEGYILMSHPAMRFSRHWDLHLLHVLRRCQPGPEAALTGYLPRPQDVVDAVSPVAAQGFDEAGRLCFHRGTPLRYARAPQRSAFLHPDFCFAPAAFYHAVASGDGPLFLRAFQHKWSLYTLHKPLLHMQWDQPLQPEAVGGAENVARFESRFGLNFTQKQLSAMARRGIFSPDLTFPAQVPVAVRLQEAFRQLQYQRGPRPLCVTASLNLPTPYEDMAEERLMWFRQLAAMKNLALLCFADSDSMRRVALQHPNVLEYKRRYGLPLARSLQPAEASNYLRLSQPFILAQGREKFINHTHYVWMDFDYLRYPVYTRAAVDWTQVCTDRIVIARVNGEPDLSMISVPDARLLILCRELTALCEYEASRTGALPEASGLWHRLWTEHPDWFEMIDMPGWRELFSLTQLSREEEFHVRT